MDVVPRVPLRPSDGPRSLYSSVGHAGASGYLAVMAFVGMSPEVMKPTAPMLNIIVASIATVRFYRAGFFSWAVFGPFMLGSIPTRSSGIGRCRGARDTTTCHEGRTGRPEAANRCGQRQRSTQANNV